MPRKRKSDTREALEEISSNLHIEYINLKLMVDDHDEFSSEELAELRDLVKEAREKMETLLDRGKGV